jgi:hypothetical protein
MRRRLNAVNALGSQQRQVTKASAEMSARDPLRHEGRRYNRMKRLVLAMALGVGLALLQTAVAFAESGVISSVSG